MSHYFEYRDMTVPYSDEELECIVEIFKSLPTFEDDSISSTDIPALLEGMRYKRTPEQNAAYKNHWDLHNGGRIPLKEFILIFKAVHERKKWFLVCATHVDKDKNGFIDSEEFKYMCEFTAAHDPTAAGVTYEQFLQEADSDHDGRISIEECADWIEERAKTAETSDSDSDYRDMSVPMTEEELENMVQIFKSMPTFKDDSILSSDIPAVLERVRYKRTPEQVEAYKKHWDILFGGKIPLKEAISIFQAIHERRKWFMVCAAHLDADKNGFIDAEEFKHMFELTASHDPTVAGVTYEQFMIEADVNHDGKISIEECADWIEKRVEAEAAANS